MGNTYVGTGLAPAGSPSSVGSSSSSSTDDMGAGVRYGPRQSVYGSRGTYGARYGWWDGLAVPSLGLGGGGCYGLWTASLQAWRGF